MIMVAPNGARRTKADHPALPMSAAELAGEAARCCDAGASAIHLHVRDDDGAHVLDAARYGAAWQAVREATGGAMAVQITTEAVGRYSTAEQVAVVRAVMPEAVSIAVRELVPDAAHEAAAELFLRWLKQVRISPQFILYDAGDVQRLHDLQARGVVPFANPFLLFVLGRYAAEQQSAPQDLEPFLNALEGRDAVWAVCAFGRREAACAEAAIAAGGHVRVGFENNLHLPDGSLAVGNADLVRCVAAAARAAGCGIMDAAETRALLADVLD
jgi:uncharacterized protein (DUF849 family)